MKRWAAFFIGIGLGFVLWYFLFRRPVGTPMTWPQSTANQDAAVAKALSNQSPATVGIIQSNFARVQPAQGNPAAGAVALTIPKAGPPTPLQFTNFEPATVVQNMSRVLHQYGEMFGGNPVGNNQEITSQLTGKNPKHINFISTEAGLNINGNGELVDPWGTPYFFHQLSGSDTEIHSAGPDRVMWTSDDIVVH